MFGAAEAKGALVFVDRYHSHWLEAVLTETLSAVVAVEFAGVFFGGAFGVDHPDHRVINGLLRYAIGELIDLLLPGCEDHGEGYVFCFADVFIDLGHALHFIYRWLEGGRGIENVNRKPILQIQLLEDGVHRV